LAVRRHVPGAVVAIKGVAGEDGEAEDGISQVEGERRGTLLFLACSFRYSAKERSRASGTRDNTGRWTSLEGAEDAQGINQAGANESCPRSRHCCEVCAMLILSSCRLNAPSRRHSIELERETRAPALQPLATSPHLL
ncbi:unnamed protein product, partial [Phaeothamnion confervicola]